MSFVVVQALPKSKLNKWLYLLNLLEYFDKICINITIDKIKTRELQKPFTISQGYAEVQSLISRGYAAVEILKRYN